MRRLHVHVEGQTEEGFVNRVLLPHLVGGFGYAIVSARLLGNPRSRLRRGGIRSWASVRKEIIRHLQTDREALATTMVDYYGLPPDTWPGRDASMQAPFVEKAAVVGGQGFLILTPSAHWISRSVQSQPSLISPLSMPLRVRTNDPTPLALPRHVYAPAPLAPQTLPLRRRSDEAGRLRRRWAVVGMGWLPPIR